jgi:glycerol uptake facilitator-like aquaporin
MSMIYFGMLLVCTPISGGHFNPALTLSVFLTCPNKWDKTGKLFLMIAAQFIGGMIGLGLARLVRINVLNDPTTATHTFYPGYTAN